MNHAWSLKGKRALVIGGTKGIGLATTNTLLTLGANVYFVARTKSDVEKLAGLYQSRQESAYGFVADMSDKNAPDAIITALNQEGVKALDILVTSFGKVIHGTCESLTDQIINQTLNLNIAAIIRSNRSFLPLLKKGQQASVINIASSNAFIATPNKSLDGLTRAAVVSLTKSVAYEWAKYGIRVNSVAPGPTKTERIQQYNASIIEALTSSIPLKRLGEPQEIANAIAFLAMSASSFITGQCILVDGGMTPCIR